MPFSLIPLILISGMLFLMTTPIQQQSTQPTQSFSSSANSKSPYLGGAVGGGSFSQSQTTISAISSQSTSSNSSQKVNYSATNPPTFTEKLQTYINPSYPNLKINYDNSWEMECTSQKARFL
jgi:hypothetical protein